MSQLPNRCSVIFVGKTQVTNVEAFSRQVSISHEGLFSRSLLIIFVSGLKGQSIVLSILGPLSQMVSLRVSEEIPRVPVSAGLSPLSIRCYWSIVVDSRISAVQLPTNTGNLLHELSHCRTVVLSVCIKTSGTSNVRPFEISFFKLVARRAAWSFSFGIIKSAFLGATRGLPNTKALSILCKLVTRARRKETAQNTSCELSPNMWSSIRSKSLVK